MISYILKHSHCEGLPTTLYNSRLSILFRDEDEVKFMYVLMPYYQVSINNGSKATIV